MRLCHSAIIRASKNPTVRKALSVASNWQEGYGAFTYSLRDEPDLILYLKGQEEHHRRVTFEEEYKKLLMDAGIKIDERYFP